jgi:hypothetical protein
MPGDWDQYIKSAHEKYKKIGAVPCPAFGNELIYFTRDGWNHLIRKGKTPREVREQYLRIRLLTYAEYIIRRCTKVSNFKENIINKYPAYFWTITRYIDGIHIRIIIRQLGTGRKHYFSIMNQQ